MRLKAGMHSAGTRWFQESRKVLASASNFVPAPVMARAMNSFCVSASRVLPMFRWIGPQVWLYSQWPHLSRIRGSSVKYRSQEPSASPKRTRCSGVSAS